MAFARPPRRATPARVLVVVVVVGLATTACTVPVPTARSAADYDRKAGNTADTVHSAVETARLALRSADEGRLFRTTLEVLVTEAESDAGGAEATFRAIQPKGQGADDTRAHLLEILDAASTSLEAARIAVRRGDDGARRAQEAPLRRVSQELDAFVEELG